MGICPTARRFSTRSYNTVERLLAGDLLHTVTITDGQADLVTFPPDWPVVGVDTTDWIGRNGEMMPDGTAGHLRFWWADPATPSGKDGQNMGGAVYDLFSPSPCLPLSVSPRLPFLGLAIGDPAMAIT
ncbi:MAG: hypothetical protein ISS50_05525 [Anaerolineae bacterium]|nr:hypothetical protein [Anaerolineae bacterium]